MAVKNYTDIINEMNAYLTNVASNKSIVPSLVNGTFTDLMDSLFSQLKYVVQQVVTLTSVTNVVTIDLQEANHFSLSLTEDITLEFTNTPSIGYNGTYVINCIQDVTGGHTITNGTNVIDVDGVADPKTGGDEKFQLWLYWDGTSLIKNVVNL